MTPDEHTAKIAALNDALRASVCFLSKEDHVFFSHDVANKSPDFRHAALEAVRTYSDFNEGNNPYGERDFGAFEIEGEKLFWKIDYYDKSMEAGSEDPANPNVTTRVLTVMLAEEYSAMEALPCPFCGEKPRIFTRLDEDLATHEMVDWHCVECPDCSVSFSVPDGYGLSALEAWNTRTPIDQTRYFKALCSIAAATLDYELGLESARDAMERIMQTLEESSANEGRATEETPK